MCDLEQNYCRKNKIDVRKMSKNQTQFCSTNLWQRKKRPRRHCFQEFWRADQPYGTSKHFTSNIFPVKPLVREQLLCNKLCQLLLYDIIIQGKRLVSDWELFAVPLWICVLLMCIGFRLPTINGQGCASGMGLRDSSDMLRIPTIRLQIYRSSNNRKMVTDQKSEVVTIT
jgi:hypothetical protein